MRPPVVPRPTPRATPAQAVSQLAQLPGYEAFYYGALKYGQPGKRAQSMAEVTDFQGRAAAARDAMELALEGSADENMTQDAVDQIIAMSQENPAATIEELMQIIGKA